VLATGFEALYRNRREDAKRFLEHRHGKSFWVFNLCPVNENSYPASLFDGRVSRYPFPDHQCVPDITLAQIHTLSAPCSAPPLAILPLVAREMDLWLRGAPDRVVVIHCKGAFQCSCIIDMSTHLPCSRQGSVRHACVCILACRGVRKGPS
jgi:phosphatidylinositol-3,4,5-trisphosphate 3-phosphatase/dual-specificity protein phosphatase PTEN